MSPSSRSSRSSSRRPGCPACGTRIGPADQTCQGCGEPLSFSPARDGVPCGACQALIPAYLQTCPACGEEGYPALRPRRGKGWKGSPSREA